MSCSVDLISEFSNDTVEELEKLEDDYLKEIESIKKSQKSPEPEESTSAEPIQGTELSPRTIRKRRRFEQEYLIPDKVHHEYFDKSISKYFEPSKGNSKEVEEARATKINNILLENCYRMFGITAFPVKDPSRKNSTIQTELLGIRIEIFNEKESLFEIPHYIIFSKDPKNGSWKLFKHTIPNFIQIDEIYKDFVLINDDNLYQFLKIVRRKLVKTSIKHQIVETVRKKFKPTISQLQKDISLTSLKFQMMLLGYELHILMNLSLDTIESCHIDSNLPEDDSHIISNILKGDITQLIDKLKDIIDNYTLSA